jgi:branched-chain amino acid transport system substrate-binding protein
MKKIWNVLATLLALGIVHPAMAQIPGGKLRIGVLNDQSGPFSSSSGTGSVVAAHMAAEDFGGTVAGVPIEIVSADHQNKPDVGSALARRWLERDNVAAIVDLGNSSVALAVSEIASAHDRPILVSAGATSALTGKACAPTTVHWTYDSWALASAVAHSVLKTGGKSWFFVTADYAFGTDLQESATAVLEANGGAVVGSVRHPLGALDLSSFLLQAQASRAAVIALANGGSDMATAVKEAHEFGLLTTRRLTALTTTIQEIHSLGLDTAQGLVVAEPFYWDLDDGTRAWSRSFAARNSGQMPSMMQAGVYAAVLHYLKAVNVTGSVEGAKVVAKMKSLPTDDSLFGKGAIRSDGRKLHPIYVYQVKSPAESHGPWDYYKLIETISPNEAFRPMAAGGCPLVAAKN